MGVEDIAVRTVAVKDNWGKRTILKKGTEISVAYTQGFEGRITAPVCGWVTLRNKHSLSVVSKDYVYTEVKPTMLITNVPGNMTEIQLLTLIQANGYVTPESIVFQENNGRFRAVVE